MEKGDSLHEVKLKAEAWLEGNYDAETKKQVKNLLENNEKELIESFYRNLEFGTGGLRGIMGAGTNRMNIYTVGMATQGLSNYIKKNFKQLPEIKVAVAYDCRNNSIFVSNKLTCQVTVTFFSTANKCHLTLLLLHNIGDVFKSC
ncbi:hypothetical protein ES708_18077 [subsurface metagenome]